MARLVRCRPLGRLEITKHCKPWASRSGVYVFYRNEEPLYVGRSNGLIGRVQLHGRLGSTPNQAAFASRLTREAFFREKFPDHQDTPMSDLWKIPEFAGLKIRTVMNDGNFPGQKRFMEAKMHVCGMSIRVVELPDPNAQAMFEVYAHMVLNTPYNTFVNH